VAGQTFAALTIPELVGERLVRSRPPILCTPLHYASSLGVEPGEKPDPEALEGQMAAAATPGADGESEEHDHDPDLQAMEFVMPVKVILNTVLLSYKLHNPDDMEEVVCLASTLATHRPNALD